METKTTHDIIEGQFKTKVEEHTLRTIRLTQPIEDIAKYHQKKWIALKDIIDMLRNWNCQNNPKIRTTINTVMMRIGEKTPHKLSKT